MGCVSQYVYFRVACDIQEFRVRTVTPLWNLREEATAWMERTASFAAKGVEEIRPERLHTLKEEDEEAEREGRKKKRKKKKKKDKKTKRQKDKKKKRKKEKK